MSGLDVGQSAGSSWVLKVWRRAIAKIVTAVISSHAGWQRAMPSSTLRAEGWSAQLPGSFVPLVSISGSGICTDALVIGYVTPYVAGALFRSRRACADAHLLFRQSLSGIDCHLWRDPRSLVRLQSHRRWLVRQPSRQPTAPHSDMHSPQRQRRWPARSSRYPWRCAPSFDGVGDHAGGTMRCNPAQFSSSPYCR